MKRLRFIVVVLLTVCALGTVVASAAQAEGAPFWTIGGTRLVAGQTRNIVVTSLSTFILKTPAAGISIECTKTKSNVGVLLGSNAGEPGKNDEVFEFSGCSVTGNGGKCASPNPIITNPLQSEMVENVEEGHVGKKLLIEFFPASGNNFVTLKFSGECKVKETKVTGKEVTEVLTADVGEEPVELGQPAKQAKSWFLEFPEPPVGEVWLIKAGVGQAVETGLTAFGDASHGEGLLLVELEGGAEWSPLP